MKRLIVLLATLLLSFGLINAANICDIGVYTASGTMVAEGDTLWGLTDYTFDISMENDVLLYGLTMGWVVTGTAPYEWRAIPDAVASNPYVSGVPGSHMYPPDAIWNFGGLTISERSMDNNLPDSMLIGGVAGTGGGMNPGALERVLKLGFTLGAIGVDDKLLLCIDSSFIPPAGPFTFIDVASASIVPECLWNEFGRCWPAANAPNFCPTISGPTTMTVNHCSQKSVTLIGTDNESDAIAWGIAGNTGAGAATVNNGVVTYTPTGADVGAAVVITVFATDAFHPPTGCVTYDINVTVTNTAPGITCPANYPVGFDTPTTKTVTGTDADACDVLTFDFAAGFTPIGDMAITAAGVFTWTTTLADVGFNTVEVQVTDGYDVTTCSFVVEVLLTEPYEVVIGKEHDVYQGTFHTVPITLTKGSEAMGGFDFLMAYDNSLLTFTEASLGSYFAGCGWEYFTYRYGSHGNCGTGCPSGEIRIVGMAETNDGPHHPDVNCLKLGVGEVIANLTFFVTTDVNANGQYAQVKFFWMDCGDNVISVMSGDTLAVSRFVYNYYGDGGVDSYIEVTDNTWGFPGTYGAPNSCLVPTDKGAPIRFIDFFNGGIDIINKDDIDDRGDINMNGIANEIADAVMFTNYFIVGMTAFGTHGAGSTAASDVNADGTPLTVADLVYLVRVIIGDALPYPKPVPGSMFNAVAQGDKVMINTTEDAGAALFVFTVNGTVGTPTINNGMDIISNLDNNELRVLVYNIGSEAISNGSELTIPVSGSVELVEVEAATYGGATMETSIRNLPTSFQVHQNYPNPFNPTTTMGFDLNVASSWNVDVYNIAGQKVKSFSGYDEAGQVNVVWDATDANGSAVASGIYFYKVSAGANSATHKMILMK